MTLSSTLVAALIVIVALWLVLAAALLIISGRRLRRANAVIGSARSLASFLAAAPARPVLLHSDDRIETDEALVQALGLERSPETLSALGEATDVDPDEMAELREAIEAARLSGETLEYQLHVPSADRVFEVRGAPARDEGAMLLWLFDMTRAEDQRLRLARRLQQTEGALDSLTQLIENAPFPMWYRKPDLSLGLVNSAFVAAVEGSDAADVIARGSELIDVTGDDGAHAGALRALETGRPVSRTRPATIDGERRMLRVVDVPLAGGAVAGFALDIQDLENARIELARHVQSQRDLADRMTAGAVQFDADRKLDFYNQPFIVMSRLEPEFLDDRPEFDRLIEAMREQGRIPEVRDFPEWKSERGQWFISADEVIEEDWIVANGDHLRVVGQPLPDGGLRLIFEDRTEQVRLASARDTLLRVRAATFDNLFEAVAVFASDGRLYLWNRRFCDVWGFEEEWLSEHPRVDELVPILAKSLVNPAATAQMREMVRSTTSGRQTGSGRLAFSDGRNFDFAAVPLPDGNALFTMVDITDSTRIEAALRERAEALEEADKVKTDFVENMSYELRTPLTSIGGFAEMLEQGYAGKLEPAAKEYVDAIITSVERLSRLIDNVLDLTRTEEGALAIEQERVDLAGLVRNAAKAIEDRSKEKDQSVELDIADSCGHVLGDARRLREAFEHVLRNAADYGGEGGKILIKAGGNEGQAIVTITDDGPGIPADQQEAVFERFHKTHGRRGESALGLGLPLTRQIVQAHGGNVELVSAEGEGTSVTLVIPRQS
ncbi:sensor histidine kinase [Sphingomicrobium marinum]|uniref:sensor histidine kinase n=1 Tax=Sphingomicrobium marinum TaxID=1227950 RepID=UPI00224079F2|nr:PAS domain-containing sensor histidine kinase [Sphingomicrobium marinum]